jgi:hypothetical protein
LAQYGKQATILAGGTDLVPKINYYELKPEVLLYVGKLGLSYIKQVDGTLVIGAGTPLAQILTSELVAPICPGPGARARQHSSVLNSKPPRPKDQAKPKRVGRGSLTPTIR